MDKYERLFKQYEIMIELLKWHDKRWTDQWRTYLTIITILAAIIAGVSRWGGNSTNDNQIHLILLLASFVGMIICGVAGISLNRIRNESKFLQYELTKIESVIKRELPSKEFTPLYSNGKEFFLEERKFGSVKFTPRWLWRPKIWNQFVLACAAFFALFVFLAFVFGSHLVLIIKN